ncbi:MAG TPA: ABC transporter permease subunit, partial [Anaeromyxobacteraceae bacterium]|nr:ABC transporter permease subunit [Anaeromyxobacteraceae bacterium]
LRSSRIVTALRESVGRAVRRRTAGPEAAPHGARGPGSGRAARVASLVAFVALLAGLALGSVGLFRLFGKVDGATWAAIAGASLLTLGRVLLAVVAGTLWTVPVGLAIGLSPRLSRVLQPVVQVVASFPAPMLFPAVVALLAAAGVGLGWGSVLLMLLGTQWYVLFNVVAGAMAIPADLREAARIYRLSTWGRMRALYLPAIFPYLVTGWVTAAGGAWNASIVSEYVSYGGRELVANGLGARISVAAAAGDMPALAASVAVMALVVVLFNRLVWRRLHDLAERRFTLAR